MWGERSGASQEASARCTEGGPTYRRRAVSTNVRVAAIAIFSMVLAPGGGASTFTAAREYMAGPALGLPPSGWGIAGTMLAQALAVALGAVLGRRLARKFKVKTLRIASVPVSLLRKRRRAPGGKVEEGDDHSAVQSEPEQSEATQQSPMVISSRLKQGHSYLVEEDKPTLSLRILGDLTRGDRPGLFITRKNPRTVLEDFQLENARGLWLVADSRASGIAQALAPSLEMILLRVKEFAEATPRGAILIDGIEFLVDTNNFNSVLGFLRRAVDMVSQGEQILLVSVSPKALHERELKSLEREMDVLRTKWPWRVFPQ